MSTFITRTRLRIGLASLLLVGLFFLGGMYYFSPGAPEGRTPPCDTSSRPPEPIAPGTVVGQTAPPGWSHLIVKSMPRAARGDLGSLSDLVKDLAARFFTVLVGDVEGHREGSQTTYHLVRVGAGLGTRIKGEDRIITPQTQKELGANLDVLGRSALRLSFAKVQAFRVLAQSGSFALVDTPVLLLQEGKHRPAVIRYALLVDMQTGTLETLVWGIACDQEKNYRGPIGGLEWLPPASQQDCLLHVDARELGLLGLPTEQTVALDQVPQGRKRLPLTPELHDLGALPRLTPEQASELEGHLRRLLP